MKRTLAGLLIVALLVGVADADPFIGPAGNPTLRYSINIADGVDMTALGDTDVDWGTGDVTTTGAGSFGTVTETGGTTGTDATYSGIVIAEHFNSTDDARIADDLLVEGDADVVGAFTAGTIASDAGVSGTTGTFTEPVTVSKAIGTAPFVITSTTVVPNLNVDQVDGKEAAAFVYVDGTNPLTADWDVGAFKVTANQLASDVAIGTAPLEITSTTVVPNLNVDQVDGKDSTDLVLVDGTQALTAAWDAGSFGITAETFTSDVATGTAPFTVASTTAVTNLNADLLDGQDGSYYGTASDVSTLQARTYLHIQTITDPIVAAVDTIEGATTVDETGFTLAAVDLDAQPDVPRTLSVSPSGELTGWILFEGTNIDDEAITEYVNFSAGSALQDTTKAFKTLTQVTGAKTSGTDRTITIGQTDELGLDMTVDNDYQLMMVEFDGGIDATQTLVKDGTDVELNNINIAGTLDGSKTLWVYLIVE